MVDFFYLASVGGRLLKKELDNLFKLLSFRSIFVAVLCLNILDNTRYTARFGGGEVILLEDFLW